MDWCPLLILSAVGSTDKVRPELRGVTIDMANPADAAGAKRRIKDAAVVCVTCISAGGGVLDRGAPPFECVLIDEAAQATEGVCLVPMVKGCKSLVMCGDHHQLPPTILSRAAELEGLNVSLFERLASAGVTAHMLDIQHRMHPAIAAFPSAYFYRGRLQNAAHLNSGTRPAVPGFDWPNPKCPIAFVAARQGHEEKSGLSYANQGEAQLLANIVAGVAMAQGRQSMYNGRASGLSVGVIAPYAGQAKLITQALARVDTRALGQPPDGGIEISTVDGFQGREKDLIVFSATRANTHGNVGFVADWRRLNVTLTRARSGMIVVGNPDTLRQEPTCWRGWVEWMECNGLFVEAAVEPSTGGQLVLRAAIPGSATDGGSVVMRVAPPPPELAEATSHGLELGLRDVLGPGSAWAKPANETAEAPAGAAVAAAVSASRKRHRSPTRSHSRDRDRDRGRDRDRDRGRDRKRHRDRDRGRDRDRDKDRDRGRGMDRGRGRDLHRGRATDRDIDMGKDHGSTSQSPKREGGAEHARASSPEEGEVCA